MKGKGERRERGGRRERWKEKEVDNELERELASDKFLLIILR